jgi:hypothetical protein
MKFYQEIGAGIERVARILVSAIKSHHLRGVGYVAKTSEESFPAKLPKRLTKKWEDCKIEIHRDKN